MDTCVWLLANGVPASSIRWVKPREGWWLNRRFHQPHTLLPGFYAGIGLQFQAMADAKTEDDLFLRLEESGFLLRVDPAVMPTMLHGAILSDVELALLRQITDVVRLGRVRPARPRQHGAGRRRSADTQGSGARPLRRSRPGAPAAAPHNWDLSGDYLTAFMALLTSQRARDAYPALAAWARDSRLNPLGRLGEYSNHPTVVETRGLLKKGGSRDGECVEAGG